MELTIEKLNAHLAVFSSRDNLEITESKFENNIYAICLSMNGTILKKKTCTLGSGFGIPIPDEDRIVQTRESFLLALFLDGIIIPARPKESNKNETEGEKEASDKKLDVNQKLTLLHTLHSIREAKYSEGQFITMINNSITSLVTDLMKSI